MRWHVIKQEQIQKSQLVLVVDDFEINRDILGMMLEDDYEVAYATNGKEALDFMFEHAYDLSIVLLDLIMPVMNGFEVLEAVRKNEQLKTIPIIVLTAEKSAELKALQLGASDFITKPFDVHEIILARVSRVIELSEGRQLISSAETDFLTGLYTRNFFFEYANRLFTYHPETHRDAVVINVEQFHTINALNGRDFGDRVLRCIGDSIMSCLQHVEGIAARNEADRFDIYCAAQEDYARMLACLQSKVNELSPSVSIHLRMGVMPWHEGLEPIVMFDRASAACNMARGNFQSPLMIFNDNMLKRELLNQRLLNDLQAARTERQLRVFYQPKYDIQCTPPRLASAEALIRWWHPELGIISPGDFVPLLEGNGLIGMVDAFVWQEAARQVAEWRETYGIDLPVSVNLSRTDVFDPTLVERLVNLIEDNQIDYKSIKLEVTESAYTDNAKQVLDVIARLRDAGFQIEMDDFGSGYSSLNMLSDMPIDVLKMDMKFVRNIEHNATDRRLVALILDIARYLEVKVIAEGVETEGQLDLLREGGCDLVQGFYFSRPLPPEEFEELIKSELATERN